MLEQITEAIMTVIRDIGYPGLFLLMLCESTFVPIPSVLVMPFAGFLVFHGDMSAPLVLLSTSAGAIVGSWLFYQFGARGGKPILLKVGKWFLVKPADIDKTEAYFNKPGKLTVFIARFIPVVRHFISFVAGLGHMPMQKFLLQTFLGATIWNSILLTVGYVLGANWQEVVNTWKKFDYVIGGLIIAAALYFLFRWRKKRKDAQSAPVVTA